MRHGRRLLTAGTILAAIAAAGSLDPVPQDPAYHAFADTRTLAGIPNFGNVISNLPFLLVGAFGIGLVLRDESGATRAIRSTWLGLFGGMVLTGAGSAHYHLAPDNASLALDRMAMTVGFMSLLAVTIGEYVSAPLARRLLPVLLATGVASVLYWSYTESMGIGDLRPYGLVQFLPLLLIPLLVVSYRGRSDMSGAIGWLILVYAGAKASEHFDAEILQVTRFASGHALKHVLAALAPVGLLIVLARRRKHI